MMKFIFKENSKRYPTFKEVREGQFFVLDGMLYQKVDLTRGHIITDSRGKLVNVNWFSDFHKNKEVDRILPEVEKIEY